MKVTELTSAAETIATTTGDVHSSFGGLQAFYQAPEADQLFATTKPVATSGQTLKSDLKSIAGALSTYSDEVHPLVEKLKEIKRDAGAFLVKINADDKWREDGDLIEENNHRRDEIAETLAAFQEAEVACYNKIVALVCLLPLKTSDGSDSKNQYGFDAETLKQAEGLPWGDPLVESTPGWQVWEHAWDFTKGFFVDGVWGTVKGLGTLVGFDGWDAAGQAWKGLAQLATGVAISLSPVAAVQFWTAKDEDLPTWLRESRTAVKETGKALIAYDQWGENPSRAAGAVTFNVVTTVFTGGTGGAVAGGGKAALAAKALSAAGKVGRFVDPMTYIFKGAGFGLTKVGDAMAGLKGLGTIEIPPLPDNVFTLPEGAVRLPDGTVDLPAGAAIPEGAVRLADGTVRLPKGVIALPEGTLKNPFDEGAAYADRKGNLYDESGNLVQRAEDARTEPGKTDSDADTPDHTRVETPVRQPVLVGAGARVGDGFGDAGRAESNVPGSGAADRSPGGTANHMPSNSLGDHAPAGHNGEGAQDTAPAPQGGNGSAHTPKNEPHGHSGESGTAHRAEQAGTGHHAERSDHGGAEEGPGNDAPDSSGAPRDSVNSGESGESKAADGPSSVGDHHPMVRGSETESRLQAAIKEIPGKQRPNPKVLERVLERLSMEPGGQRIADVIASGHFSKSDGFGQVVSSLGANKTGMFRPGADQLIFADDLVRIGVPAHTIDFEHKIPVGSDLDIRIKGESGEIYGYQLKRLNNPLDPVSEITRNKYLLQLAKAEADHRVFLVDGARGTRADWISGGNYDALMDIHHGRNGAKGEGITFVIRLNDGTLVIPPGSKIDPKDML
ncbi:hypothetical protein [Streptomyces pratensis]|uniref:hypothetical protein n=1 Tax=Streptomyces pratensis TaxID=1169025 RepID=UPI0036290FA6